MSIPDEKQIIGDTLNSFGEALNSANIKKIPLYFAADGIFMPEATRSFSGKELRHTTGNFFAKNAFSITFSIEELEVDGVYAFVHARANTVTTIRATGIVYEKMTRDFFVLRKEGVDWKIYRYMFNHLNT
jgi:ketosteroid isomerase-like protein